MHYRPKTAVLNNLEFDHADIFADLAAIETQFHHLVRTIPSNGLIIRPTAAPALDRVLARGCWTPVQMLEAVENQITGLLNWDLSGEHNRLNALAAITAAQHVGIAPAQSCEALNRFQGIKRRMELRATVNNIYVYDDFAHHPTAIALTLEGLRKQLGANNGRIIAVLEPRSNTMKLGAMSARLPESLAMADHTFCYSENRGKHALTWDAAAIFAPLGDKATIITELSTLARAVVNMAQPNDHIVIMSNGSFGGIHEKIIQGLNV